MKERIEQLAAGEVLVKKPELDFSPAYLEGRVEAGTVQNKELVIRVRNRVPFKGFLYSTTAPVISSPDFKSIVLISNKTAAL